MNREQALGELGKLAVEAQLGNALDEFQIEKDPFMDDVKAERLQQLPDGLTTSRAAGPLPNNIQKCHQIMKGLRLILLLKDDKIKKLQIANGGELM